MSDIDRSATEKTVALPPALRGLSPRGMRAWVEEMVVRPLGGRYVVESESGGVYVVDLQEGTCTCPDHQIRGKTCKHLRRVAIEITARRVPPPETRRISCQGCGTNIRVDPSDGSQVLCSSCRLEPGDVVLDRETGERLVVVNVTDNRADETDVQATGTSVADYPTNEGYPDDDIVVEAIYVADVSRNDDPRRYLFPLSRLTPVHSSNHNDDDTYSVE